MATNFPSSLDSFTNPTATDTLDSPPHDQQHANINDAVEALEAKVGVDGSAVTTSIDYQLNTGYRYHSTVYFTSSGSFTKATYPWLRAVRVKVQAGGGGSGSGDAMAAGEAVASGGAGGGCYAESFITDIASLAASVTVTVGSGGAGGAGGAGNGASGTAGGDSEFGAGTAYEVSAGGGNESARGFESNLNGFGAATPPRRVGTGDLVLAGGAGAAGLRMGTAVSGAVVLALGGTGGNSVLGMGGRGADLAGTTGVEQGPGGSVYGGGAGGCAGVCDTGTQDGPDGGSGGDGIVIVELYA